MRSPTRETARPKEHGWNAANRSRGQPSWLSHEVKVFPDGRDLNRQFPGDPGGSTTRRVADQVWRHLVEDSDGIIDLHSAAKGRKNMPQVRVDLTHTSSYLLAKLWH